MGLGTTTGPGDTMEGAWGLQGGQGTTIYMGPEDHKVAWLPQWGPGTLIRPGNYIGACMGIILGPGAHKGA